MFEAVLQEVKVALKLEDKKTIVAEVNQVALSAVSVVAADYRGLTVSQMSKLRKNAREANVYMRVIRNTLASRALEGTEFACLQPELVGPTILAFSLAEPSAAARLLRDFIKENEKMTIKVLSIGGKLLSAKDLEIVAKLPTRNEAIASLMAVMKAPITKLVRTLAEPHGKLVRTFAAVRDKKQSTA